MSSQSIWHFETVSSALDVAWHLALASRLAEWDSVLAKQQTAGRGQMRRTWYSPEGNVYAALRLPFSPLFASAAAAPAMGCLLATAMEKLGLPVKIKWPNDIVYEDFGRPVKIAGILLEERAGIALAGLGINLNNAPNSGLMRKEAALEASSLVKVCPDLVGRFGCPSHLWQSLVKCIFSIYTNQKFLLNWQKLAESFLLWRHQTVMIRDGNHEIRGMLNGLSPSGELLLVSNGVNQLCHSGSLALAD